MPFCLLEKMVVGGDLNPGYCANLFLDEFIADAAGFWLTSEDFSS